MRLSSEDTQTAILDAAIAIAGGQGASAVTHRSVAKLAGVAVGSISYHFSSTDQLLEAALRRAGYRERRRVQQSRPADPSDPEAWVNGLVEHLAITGDTDRERKLAAFELMLEAARRPSLRTELEAWQSEYLHTATAALSAAGSADPASDAPLLLSALLGLDLAQLSAGGFPAPALHAAISGFVRRLVQR